MYRINREKNENTDDNDASIPATTRLIITVMINRNNVEAIIFQVLTSPIKPNKAENTEEILGRIKLLSIQILAINQTKINNRIPNPIGMNFFLLKVERITWYGSS